MELKTNRKHPLLEAMTRACAATGYEASLNRSATSCDIIFTTFENGVVKFDESEFSGVKYSEVLSTHLYHSNEYRIFDRENRHRELTRDEFMDALIFNFNRHGVDFMKIYREELENAAVSEAKANDQ